MPITRSRVFLQQIGQALRLKIHKFADADVRTSVDGDCRAIWVDDVPAQVVVKVSLILFKEMPLIENPHEMNIPLARPQIGGAGGLVFQEIEAYGEIDLEVVPVKIMTSLFVSSGRW